MKRQPMGFWGALASGIGAVAMWKAIQKMDTNAAVRPGGPSYFEQGLSDVLSIPEERKASRDAYTAAWEAYNQAVVAFAATNPTDAEKKAWLAANPPPKWGDYK
jgi:hypothetical protein